MPFPKRGAPAGDRGAREFDRAGKADRPEDRANGYAKQGALFDELIETAWTGDEWFDDLLWLNPDPDCRGCTGTRPGRPHGAGWRISNFRQEKRTRWTRRRAVILQQSRCRLAGGAC